MIIVNASPNDYTLALGRAGENEARQIVFDISAWRAGYGEGAVVLLHQRAKDTAPYPAAITVEGSTVTWLVTSADTAQSGTGGAELQYLVNNVVVKSQTWQAKVEPALGEPVEAPEPEQGWVSQLLEDIKEIVAQGGAVDADGVAQAVADYLSTHEIKAIAVAG